MNTTINLIPTDSHKSFYGKAKVITYGGTTYLKSYDTIVCSIVGGKFNRIWDGWSATTQRHINAFLQEYADGQSGKAFFISLPYEENPTPAPVLRAPRRTA